MGPHTEYSKRILNTIYAKTQIVEISPTSMERRSKISRTFEFDIDMLKELNEFAGRKGEILEYWLPDAIRDVLIPALHEKGIVGLEHLVPGKDFPIPFTSETYQINSEPYPYQLGSGGFEKVNTALKGGKDLRGQYNRFLPVILCVKVVAKYSKYKPMSTDEYYTLLRKHAYSVRLSLLNKSEIHYRQRGPYDGLPAHRSESRTRNAAREQSSWKRFIRYFGEVNRRQKGGGLAQRMNLITMDEEGNVILTETGAYLAELKNPIMEDTTQVFDELVQSTLSLVESEVLLQQIEHIYPSEFEKLGELVLTLSSKPMTRAELLGDFGPIKGMSPSKRSAELNGMMGRAIDLHIVKKVHSMNYTGDGRSSSRFVLNLDIDRAILDRLIHQGGNPD